MFEFTWFYYLRGRKRQKGERVRANPFFSHSLVHYPNSHSMCFQVEPKQGTKKGPRTQSVFPHGRIWDPRPKYLCHYVMPYWVFVSRKLNQKSWNSKVVCYRMLAFQAESLTIAPHPVTPRQHVYMLMIIK